MNSIESIFKFIGAVGLVVVLSFLVVLAVCGLYILAQETLKLGWRLWVAHCERRNARLRKEIENDPFAPPVHHNCRSSSMVSGIAAENLNAGDAVFINTEGKFEKCKPPVVDKSLSEVSEMYVDRDLAREFIPESLFPKHKWPSSGMAAKCTMDSQGRLHLIKPAKKRKAAKRGKKKTSAKRKRKT